MTFVSLLASLLAGLACGGITLSPEPAASVSPNPSATLAPTQRKSLLRDFERAQATAISALLNRQRKEMAELKANQKARRKEWVEKERIARHQFLAEKHKGPEIRTYMRDYQDRLKALDRMIAEERAQRLREHEARFESEKRDQSAHHQEFIESLNRGERPADRLWPSPSSGG